MREQRQHSIGGSFRRLAVAVISSALADIEGARSAVRTSDRDRDEAMAWINGPECEAYCYALDIDYKTIRERGAELYRRFLERAEGRGEIPGRLRKRHGRFPSDSGRKNEHNRRMGNDL